MSTACQTDVVGNECTVPTVAQLLQFYGHMLSVQVKAYSEDDEDPGCWQMCRVSSSVTVLRLGDCLVVYLDCVSDEMSVRCRRWLNYSRDSPGHICVLSRQAVGDISD